MPKVTPPTLEVPKAGSSLQEIPAYVLEAHKNQDGNIIVLLLLPFTVQPFASGILVAPSEWVWGRYFDNVNEALSDYLERT